MGMISSIPDYVKAWGDHTCFARGTLVHTKNGLQAIETIRVGDYVAARHQANVDSPLHWRKVTDTFQHVDKLTVDLVVTHENGESEVITTTTEHPFYVRGKGWVPTDELVVGDGLEMLDQSVSTLTEIAAGKGLQTVYNFTVEEDHTYFVGARGVWVHNSYEESEQYEAGGKALYAFAKGVGNWLAERATDWWNNPERNAKEVVAGLGGGGDAELLSHGAYGMDAADLDATFNGFAVQGKAIRQGLKNYGEQFFDALTTGNAEKLGEMAAPGVVGAATAVVFKKTNGFGTGRLLAFIEGPEVPSGGATFGNAVSSDYKATFFAQNPELKGQVVVHHAVEQQVLKRYPGVVTEAEMHSLENLRGIPKDKNSDLHLSKIRREWNQFYRENPSPTKQDLLKKATEIDKKYGPQFNPPIKE